MRWILAYRLWLEDWRNRRKQKKSGDAAALAQARASFAASYEAVYCACAELQTKTQQPPLELARRYMCAVLEEQALSWWTENGEYAAQPFFIWSYGCARGLITPGAEEKDAGYFILEPAQRMHEGVAYLRLLREPENPEEGALIVEYAQADEAFAQRMRQRRFKPMEGQGLFGRRVRENAAPLLDRGAEDAALLLEAGYAVCVTERALHDRIAAHTFEPEHFLWILTSNQPDRLRLIYPHVERIHRYVCKAGGKWTGKYMEIPICYADRLEELTQLYGFRITRGAQRRIEAWQEAVRRTTLYRPRTSRAESVRTEDMFTRLLNAHIQVPDDLKDEHE